MPGIISISCHATREGGRTRRVGVGSMVSQLTRVCVRGRGRERERVRYRVVGGGWWVRVVGGG
jgi:hypothetical protein